MNIVILLVLGGYLTWLAWKIRRTPPAERYGEVVVVSDSGEVFPVTDEWPVQDLLRTVDEIEAL